MHNNLLLANPAGDDKLYVEDVFSTYLYTGNGSTQTITNGIDLAGKGGLVWYKRRNDSTNHFLADTTGTVGDTLSSNNNGQKVGTGHITAFNSNGYTLNSFSGGNGSGVPFASWTFRKAPKFFDVVTYTGNGAVSRQINHSLGTAPGMVIVKSTSNSGTAWAIWHRSLGATTNNLYFDTNTASNYQDFSRASSPGTMSDTSFCVSGGYGYTNENGQTYVAYLFAHDTTADGVIQCGSYVGTGTAGVNITLGWETQFLLVKNTSSVADWRTIDIMRAFTGNSGGDLLLSSNSSAADTPATRCRPTATGFEITANNAADFNTSGSTFIYMAIRRGPMRTPTDATKVFDVRSLTTSENASTPAPANITTDLFITRGRTAALTPYFYDRLRGTGIRLATSQSNPDGDVSTVGPAFDTQTGIRFVGTYSGSYSVIRYFLRRAPGFFDIVCYTGTGFTTTLTHNLGVAPELIIFKVRTSSGSWAVYNESTGTNKKLILQTVGIPGTDANFINSTSPTTSSFTIGNSSETNGNGSRYVAYLFASCPGVSKIGSYTGNGSSLNIDCGFTNGARFVLIKRTDSTGDWYVWDTARGIVSATDPHISLNTAVSEVTTNDSIDPLSSGFTVNQVADTNINVSGGTYIYLAIA